MNWIILHVPRMFASLTKRLLKVTFPLLVMYVISDDVTPKKRELK